MVSALSEQNIIGYFKNKSILITGSTGFLGKILVEKILRVQPDVKKVYLPVRAVDDAAAKQRVETEVLGKELFGLLREIHGDGFQSFIGEKIVPLSGDLILEDFGINSQALRELQLTHELEVIVNSAATTNFNERYDIALDVNVMGVKRMCDFAKKCPNLEVLIHVSTAYVAGEKQGLVQERLFKDGETLLEGTHLDIDAEFRLAKDLKKKHEADANSSSKAMKDLGISRARHFGWPNTYVFTKSMGEMMLAQLTRGEGGVPAVIVRPSIITSIRTDPLPGWIEDTRTIDTILIGFAKQNLTCFPGDPGVAIDLMPGDMVVNAILAATVASASLSKLKKVVDHTPTVYHVSSSLRHPALTAVLYGTANRYFQDNAQMGPNGRTMPARKMWLVRSMPLFHLYMVLKYRLLLELLHLLSILCCGLFGLGLLYHEQARKYRFWMKLADLYGPFALFKGYFDDVNLNKLRLAMADDHGSLFNFDAKTIDWEDYFYRVHIPGAMKYLCNN